MPRAFVRWMKWAHTSDCLAHMSMSFNTYNAAGVSRRQDQNVTYFVKNVNILEFGYFIWNTYEKCIQKSPNMPGIGLLICEIDVRISEI